MGTKREHGSWQGEGTFEELGASSAKQSEGSKETQTAEVIRKEEMFGKIRVRCPLDLTEWEIPAGSKDFICPIEGNKYLLKGLE